ncbi:helix-turn-helix domain-containing protein [Flavobacterium sp. 2]|uniref:winged helix-turn-helix transcriptional regulator n=1 Tax=Flavobacterium sp. 2 TaxID=308053 RepID=UPI000C175007|nr:helix-turn-helix domain-containing protein [Flavobacterium sp. 2]PIF71301.1 HxlR family transcriptional regulator [Flavobacterium sp. 2]
MDKSRDELPEHCRISIVGITDIQDIMGGKWKYLIVTILYFSGKLRFLDLKRQINKIAPKVLSKELKDLEMNNLVTRTVCDTKPITVEYELTSLGRSLNTVIEAMGDWGINYRNAILKK